MIISESRTRRTSRKILAVLPIPHLVASTRTNGSLYDERITAYSDSCGGTWRSRETNAAKEVGAYEWIAGLRATSG